jgi:hypothetical protein
MGLVPFFMKDLKDIKGLSINRESHHEVWHYK